MQLLKDKAATQDKLAELQQKAVDVQMLKFGQVLSPGRVVRKVSCGICNERSNVLQLAVRLSEHSNHAVTNQLQHDYHTRMSPAISAK